MQLDLKYILGHSIYASTLFYKSWDKDYNETLTLNI